MDWLAVRSKKRSPLTKTVWKAIKRDAENVGLSPAQAVQISAEHGWVGFQPEWLDKGKRPKQSTAERNAEGMKLLGIKPPGDIIDAE